MFGVMNVIRRAVIIAAVMVFAVTFHNVYGDFLFHVNTFLLDKMAHPAGLEPTRYSFAGNNSIQLNVTDAFDHSLKTNGNKEPVAGIEPASPDYKTGIIAIILNRPKDHSLKTNGNGNVPGSQTLSTGFADRFLIVSARQWLVNVGSNHDLGINNPRFYH